MATNDLASRPYLECVRPYNSTHTNHLLRARNFATNNGQRVAFCPDQVVPHATEPLDRIDPKTIDKEVSRILKEAKDANHSFGHVLQRIVVSVVFVPPEIFLASATGQLSSRHVTKTGLFTSDAGKDLDVIIADDTSDLYKAWCTDTFLAEDERKTLVGVARAALHASSSGSTGNSELQKAERTYADLLKQANAKNDALRRMKDAIKGKGQQERNAIRGKFQAGKALFDSIRKEMAAAGEKLDELKKAEEKKKKEDSPASSEFQYTGAVKDYGMFYGDWYYWATGESSETLKNLQRLPKRVVQKLLAYGKQWATKHAADAAMKPYAALEPSPSHGLVGGPEALSAFRPSLAQMVALDADDEHTAYLFPRFPLVLWLSSLDAATKAQEENQAGNKKKKKKKASSHESASKHTIASISLSLSDMEDSQSQSRKRGRDEADEKPQPKKRQKTEKSSPPPRPDDKNAKGGKKKKVESHPRPEAFSKVPTKEKHSRTPKDSKKDTEKLKKPTKKKPRGKKREREDDGAKSLKQAPPAKKARKTPPAAKGGRKTTKSPLASAGEVEKPKAAAVSPDDASKDRASHGTIDWTEVFAEFSQSCMGKGGLDCAVGDGNERIAEAAKQLQSHGVVAEFSDLYPSVAMNVPALELEKMLDALGDTEATLEPSMLMKTFVTAIHLNQLPFQYAANTIRDRSAAIEESYTDASVDHLTSPSGQQALTDLVKRIVLSIQVMCRALGDAPASSANPEPRVIEAF